MSTKRFLTLWAVLLSLILLSGGVSVLAQDDGSTGDDTTVDSPPPAPTDSDGDGLTDDGDACPDEGDAGYGLGSDGCPLSPPTSAR